jgi:hypothetical protein
MNTTPLTFGQVYPYLKRDDTFVLIDKNEQSTSYEPMGNRYNLVYDLLNKRVLEIRRFRFGMYDEEDYVGIKLDYDKEELV